MSPLPKGEGEGEDSPMCRSIKRLRQPNGPAGAVEIAEAARQYVRKVSGMQRPSVRNEEAFEQAVEEIAFATARLLNRLPALQQRSTRPDVSSTHPVRQIQARRSRR